MVELMGYINHSTLNMYHKSYNQEMAITTVQGLSGCLEWKNCFLPTDIHI